MGEWIVKILLTIPIFQRYYTHCYSNFVDCFQYCYYAHHYAQWHILYSYIINLMCNNKNAVRKSPELVYSVCPYIVIANIIKPIKRKNIVNTYAIIQKNSELVAACIVIMNQFSLVKEKQWMHTQYHAQYVRVICMLPGVQVWNDDLKNRWRTNAVWRQST